MQSVAYKLIGIALCICCLIVVLLKPLVRSASVYAAPPPRPSVTPRPTPTATPTATNIPSPATKTPLESKPQVATLLLRVHPAQDGLWSVVQWQDASGNWHDVEGWRGTVVNGKTIWWVEQKDFDKGPYRWVVYQGNSNAPIATSQPFQLPDLPQAWLEISVSLPE
jgi:hypothetical protein